MGLETLRVEGGRIQAGPGQVPGVQVFRGVPFAASTAGEQRWRAPQPVAEWSGVRGARFADACPQPAVPADNIMRQFSFAVPPECGQSEECLNLNVWTPTDRPASALPVIVWLYGGGHRVGAGSHPISWGDHLARLGCVVVAPNYRVGALGYLAHPALTAESGASGNYQYLDVLSALHWVQRNIRTLGGDPQRVTLWGQSAGGALVNILLASPRSRGLFHRAIIASAGRMRGGPMGHNRTLAQAQQDGTRLMDALGVSTAAQLRALSPQALFAPPGTWNPIIDGTVLAEPVQSVFDRGAQLPIPVMTGWTGDEALPFPLTDLHTRQGLLAHAGSFGADKDEFLQLYDASSDESARAASYQLRADIAFAYQPWQIARAQQRSGASAYVFNWLHSPPLPQSLHFHQPRMPFGYGAYHGAEIWYAFGNLSQQPWGWTDVDRQLAGRFGRYLVNFAARGDPNGDGLPSWPAFDPQQDVALQFGDVPQAGVISNRRALHFFDRRFRAGG